MTGLVLASDLGGTNLRIGSVDEEGKIVFSVKRPTPEDVSPDQLTDLMRQMSEECFDAAGGKNAFCAVSFTAPAPVARDFDGILTKLPNLPTLVGMDLTAALESLFGLPVTVENDATAAAIGEGWIGAARGIDNFICMTLGTGIGGGIVIGGEAVRGKDGVGGEIGHMTVEPDGHPCGCGSHGCIEQYGSATALTRMAVESGLGGISSEDLYKMYEKGDPRAKQVFAKMGNYIGISLAGLANALNPDMFVICGGVTQGWDAFAPSIVSEVERRAFEAAAKRARVVKGELGDNAGMIGAARSARIRMSRA